MFKRLAFAVVLLTCTRIIAGHDRSAAPGQQPEAAIPSPPPCERRSQNLGSAAAPGGTRPDEK